MKRHEPVVCFDQIHEWFGIGCKCGWEKMFETWESVPISTLTAAANRHIASPCPECAVGKHGNCTTTVLDEQDNEIPCSCDLIGHGLGADV